MRAESGVRTAPTLMNGTDGMLEFWREILGEPLFTGPLIEWGQSRNIRTNSKGLHQVVGDEHGVQDLCVLHFLCAIMPLLEGVVVLVQATLWWIKTEKQREVVMVKLKHGIDVLL